MYFSQLFKYKFPRLELHNYQNVIWRKKLVTTPYVIFPTLPLIVRTCIVPCKIFLENVSTI